jgi:hypothetical protein
MTVITHANEELQNLYDYLDVRNKKLTAKIERIDEYLDILGKKRKELLAKKEDTQNCMDAVVNVHLERRFSGNAEKKALRVGKRAAG